MQPQTSRHVPQQHENQRRKNNLPNIPSFFKAAHPDAAVVLIKRKDLLIFLFAFSPFVSFPRSTMPILQRAITVITDALVGVPCNRVLALSTRKRYIFSSLGGLTEEPYFFLLNYNFFLIIQRVEGLHFL